MILRLKRTPGIFLVGFMGCGKTTVGRLLAQELGWQFVDMDDDIEEQAQTSISEIFDTRGESEFRALETAAIANRIREIERGHASVVALGGGAFVQENNVSLIAGNGISIWLDCSLEVLCERVALETHRPLARDPEKFARLYAARQGAYGQADYRVDAGGDPATVLRQILTLPIFEP